MPTIALVDDDRNILTSVSIVFEAEGACEHKRVPPIRSGPPKRHRSLANFSICRRRADTHIVIIIDHRPGGACWAC